MIHVTQLRITNGKLYKRRMYRKFVRNQDELEQLQVKIMNDFIADKYPGGLPPQDPESRTPFITVDSTYVSIPDREFLHYLVAELKFKSIPPKLLNLFRKP
jgi:hypothetical protein